MKGPVNQIKEFGFSSEGNKDNQSMKCESDSEIWVSAAGNYEKLLQWPGSKMVMM